MRHEKLMWCGNLDGILKQKKKPAHYVKTKKIGITYGLYFIMHQYWFINYDKSTILM